MPGLESIPKQELYSDKATCFRQRLRLIREARGMTQSDLAKASNISACSINQFESGRNLPTLKNFISLILALHCTADYLLFDLQQCDFEDGYRRGAFDAVEAMKAATKQIKLGVDSGSN